MLWGKFGHKSKSCIISQPERADIIEIQNRILESLSPWYLGPTDSNASLVFAQEKEYRWSRQLLFRIGGSGPHADHRILVKFLRLRDSAGRTQSVGRSDPDAHKLEYEALGRLHKYLKYREYEGITAVRPLTYFPDLQVLVMEYRPGQNFLSLILAAVRPWATQKLKTAVSDAVYKGGKLLGAIHQIEHQSYPHTEAFDCNQYRRMLQHRIDNLLRVVSDSSINEKLLAVQSKVNNILANLQQTVVLNYLHGDLYPENLIELPNGCVLTVDTRLQQVGPTEDDIAKFMIGVETLKHSVLGGKILVHQDTVKTMEQSFLAGYRTEAKYSYRILLLSKLAAFIKRWSEMLSVLEIKVPSSISSAFKKTRVTPFMLACLDRIHGDINKQFDSS